MATTVERKEALNPYITITPKPEHLYEWWTMLKGDPDDIAVAFADGFPTSLDAFLERLWNGTYCHLHFCLNGDDVAGSLWLHDALTVNGTIIGGWVAGYTPPHYRHIGHDMWKAVSVFLADSNIRHLFSAVNEHNRMSCLYTRRVMGFHRVGKFPAFTRFDGEPTTVVIYTQNKADADLAWEEANKRAQRNMG